MKVKRAISAFLSMALICTYCCSCSSSNNSASDEITSAQETSDTTIESSVTDDRNYVSTRNLLECRHYNKNDFNQFTLNSKCYDTKKLIRCGVVPHHLLAGNMIADFFKTAAENNPDVETVVIIATMHDPENDKLCTTLSDWSAPNGILKNDTDFSQRLISKLGAAENDDMLQTDHSAAGLIPFVKYYLPDASVSCLLVSGTVGNSGIDDISEALSELSAEKNCLFVFSVDFSHYLDPEDTHLHDDETLDAVMNGDLDRIAKMDNANMDSPVCICTFLKLSNILDCEVEDLDHSNSLEISRLPYTHPSFANGLTSYFIFAATE